MVAAKKKGSFASDNLSGCAPELMAAIANANSAQKFAAPYGADEFSQRACMAIAREVLGAEPTPGQAGGEWSFTPPSTDANGVDPNGVPTRRPIPFKPPSHVLLCFSGTGANCLALAGLCEEPYHYVVTSDWAHINTDETGAPEHLADVKLEAVRTEDGKLTRRVTSSKRRKTESPSICKRGHHLEFELLPEVATLVQKGKQGFLHRPQPRVICITQPTEYGAVYTKDEILLLADFAHEHGLYLHMDGARISNAAAALGCKSLYEATFALGIDSLSLGLTKNGGMMLEAVVFRPGVFHLSRSNVFGGSAVPGVAGGEIAGIAKALRELERNPKPEVDATSKSTSKMLDRVLDVEEQRRLHRLQHLRKQFGQLNSKMRFASAQYPVMLLDSTAECTTNGVDGQKTEKLWHRNAQNANGMVVRLQVGLRALNADIAATASNAKADCGVGAGIADVGDGGSGGNDSNIGATVADPPQFEFLGMNGFPTLLANTLFVKFPDPRIADAMMEHWLFMIWGPREESLARLICAFDTNGEEVDGFLADLRIATAKVLGFKGLALAGK